MKSVSCPRLKRVTVRWDHTMAMKDLMSTSLSIWDIS